MSGLAIRLALGLIGAAMVMPAPAIARMSTARFRSLDLGGLRLGMSLPAVENFMRARDDLEPPRATYIEDADCRERAASAPGDPPRTINEYQFSVGSGGFYAARFYQLPSGPVVSGLVFSEYRKASSWRRTLAEAEARYGKADYIYRGTGRYDGIEAGWCAQSAATCERNNSDAGKLTLTFYPEEADHAESGDRLYLTLDSPTDEFSAREDAEEALIKGTSVRGRRLLAQCRARNAAPPDEMHPVTLIGNGMDARPIIRDWRKVPPGVFVALNVDPGKQFAPGMCLPTHTTVMIEDNGCTGYSAIRFSWARRMGPSWVIATALAGRVPRPRYFVVAPKPAGGYEAVWQGSIGQLAAWKKAGSKPLTRAEIDAR